MKGTNREEAFGDVRRAIGIPPKELLQTALALLLPRLLVHLCAAEPPAHRAHRATHRSQVTLRWEEGGKIATLRFPGFRDISGDPLGSELGHRE